MEVTGCTMSPVHLGHHGRGIGDRACLAVCRFRLSVYAVLVVSLLFLPYFVTVFDYQYFIVVSM